MKEFERFLETARQLQEPDSAGVHLSETVLTEYVYEQLLDEQAGRVAAHLVRCEMCQVKVTELRVERVQLEQGLAAHLPPPAIPKLVPRWRTMLISFWQKFQEFFVGSRPVFVHAMAYAGALLIFFWANAWLENYLTPSPGGTAKRPPWWAPIVWYARVLLIPWGVVLGLYVLYRWRQKRRRS